MQVIIIYRQNIKYVNVWVYFPGGILLNAPYILYSNEHNIILRSASTNARAQKKKTQRD